MSDPNKRIGGFERPTTQNGSPCATPTDAKVIQLLGGKSTHGVMFTTDQMQALEEFYGYDFKAASKEAIAHAKERYKSAVSAYEKLMADPDIPDYKKRMRRAPEPVPEDGGGFGEFVVAGSERNLFRAVKEDGLRVMAFLGRFLEPGQDPVKLIVQLMSEVGYDVGDHYEWAHEDEIG